MSTFGGWLVFALPAILILYVFVLFARRMSGISAEAAGVGSGSQDPATASPASPPQPATQQSGWKLPKKKSAIGLIVIAVAGLLIWGIFEYDILKPLWDAFRPVATARPCHSASGPESACSQVTVQQTSVVSVETASQAFARSNADEMTEQRSIEKEHHPFTVSMNGVPTEWFRIHDGGYVVKITPDPVDGQTAVECGYDSAGPPDVGTPSDQLACDPNRYAYWFRVRIGPKATSDVSGSYRFKSR